MTAFFAPAGKLDKLLNAAHTSQRFPTSVSCSESRRITVKDAPVIRELLDEALGARRRKALGITDSEEPPGQGTAETLHTIQTVLLKLIRRGELVFRGQNVGLELLQEALIEARAGREVAFEELVEKTWIAKGKSKGTMTNFFDMKTRYVKEYVDGVVERIKKDEAREYDETKPS